MCPLVMNSTLQVLLNSKFTWSSWFIISCIRRSKQTLSLNLWNLGSWLVDFRILSYIYLVVTKKTARLLWNLLLIWLLWDTFVVLKLCHSLICLWLELLSCFGFVPRFIMGFLFGGIPWYLGAVIILFTSVDHREKAGYVACSIAVSFSISCLFHYLCCRYTTLSLIHVILLSHVFSSPLSIWLPSCSGWLGILTSSGDRYYLTYHISITYMHHHNIVIYKSKCCYFVLCLLAYNSDEYVIDSFGGIFM